MIESIYNESKELTYGINLGNLKCGEGDEEISKYVTLYGNADARDVVLMAFNYLAYQKDEQFEVITFITTLVRNCSDIL